MDQPATKEDDAFGDFDAEPAKSNEPESAQKAEAPAKEDWGDIGDNEGATKEEEAKKPEDLAEDDKAFGDFGGFGDFEI